MKLPQELQDLNIKGIDIAFLQTMPLVPFIDEILSKFKDSPVFSYYDRPKQLDVAQGFVAGMIYMRDWANTTQIEEL